jgi:hypothetical protein
MWLQVHSNASCLSLLLACSGAGGHFIPSTQPSQADKAPTLALTLSSPVYSICKIMTNIMSSVAEGKISTTYLNAQEAFLTLTTLATQMVHPQPSMPIQVDNTTAIGFAKKTMK